MDGWRVIDELVKILLTVVASITKHPVNDPTIFSAWKKVAMGFHRWQDMWLPWYQQEITMSQSEGHLAGHLWPQWPLHSSYLSCVSHQSTKELFNTAHDYCHHGTFPSFGSFHNYRQQSSVSPVHTPTQEASMRCGSPVLYCLSLKAIIKIHLPSKRFGSYWFIQTLQIQVTEDVVDVERCISSYTPRWCATEMILARLGSAELPGSLCSAEWKKKPNTATMRFIYACMYVR